MGYSVLVRKGDDFPDSRRIQPFAPSEWETYPFADREKLRWFREAKLGLFLTVGLSALGKADLSWSPFPLRSVSGAQGFFAQNPNKL